MDKEYALMCDCPEIQGKWELKEAQIVQDRLTGWNKTVAHENSYGICLYNGCGTLITGRCKDSLIYIPSMENILEWETVGGLRTIARAMEAIMDYVAKHELWDYPLLQTCLVYHIERVHGKSWDLKERAWI